MPLQRRPRKPAQALDEAALYDYAVAALGRKMRSAAELRRLLRVKAGAGEPGESRIAAVLGRLQEQRYLDDTAFASAYARLRQDNEGFGKRRVEQDLARKGVAADLIARTLETAYQDLSEEQLARRYLARKRIGKPGGAKQAARVVRRLTAAGFSFAVISTILRAWEIELSEDDLTPGDDALGARAE